MQEPQPISEEWLENMAKHRQDFITRLFSVFMQSEPARVEKIRTALESGNIEELQFLSHSLKGAAATLGAEQVRECSLALERAAKSRDLDSAPELLRDLERAMDRTYAFMQSYLQNIESSQS